MAVHDKKSYALLNNYLKPSLSRQTAVAIPVQKSFTQSETMKRKLLSQYLTAKNESLSALTQTMNEVTICKSPSVIIYENPGCDRSSAIVQYRKSKIRRSREQRQSEHSYTKAKSQSASRSDIQGISNFTTQRSLNSQANIRRPKSTSALNKQIVNHGYSETIMITANIQKSQERSNSQKHRQGSVLINCYSVKKEKSPIRSVQIHSQQAPNPKRNQYLEAQKEKIVRKFHKSMTHQKQKLSTIQKYHTNTVQNQSLPFKNTLKFNYCNNSRNKENSVNQQPFKFLSTTCDTSNNLADTKRVSSMIFTQSTIHPSEYPTGGFEFQPSLMGTANFKAYFDTQQNFQIQSQRPKSLLYNKGKRNINNSSNSKSSKRYENINTMQSEEMDGVYHNQVTPKQETSQGKIQSICQLILASRQNSKEVIQRKSLEQLQHLSLSNDSLYGISANQDKLIHNDSQREAEEQAKISIDIAKMMIQRKKTKFLEEQSQIQQLNSQKSQKVNQYKRNNSNYSKALSCFQNLRV